MAILRLQSESAKDTSQESKLTQEVFRSTKILMAADALGVSLEKLVDPYVVNTMEIERIERQIESLESKKAIGERDNSFNRPWGDTAT